MSLKFYYDLETLKLKTNKSYLNLISHWMDVNGVEAEIIGNYVNANLNLKATLLCEAEQLPKVGRWPI
jgi:hypothetical protein